MDFTKTIYTLTLPSLTTHSQIPISWHLKAAWSRQESYFQRYWSCKKYWGRQDCEVIYFYHPEAELFLSPSLNSLLTTHNKVAHNTYYLTVWIHSFAQSCCTLLYSLSPAFLLIFPMHSFPPTPSIFTTQLCSSTSTLHSPFLGRIVAWWIVTSSNITAICSMAMPRDRASVRQASTRYPVAGYKTLPSMQWPIK